MDLIIDMLTMTVYGEDSGESKFEEMEVVVTYCGGTITHYPYLLLWWATSKLRFTGYGLQ